MNDKPKFELSIPAKFTPDVIVQVFDDKFIYDRPKITWYFKSFRNPKVIYFNNTSKVELSKNEIGKYTFLSLYDREGKYQWFDLENEDKARQIKEFIESKIHKD